MAQNGIMTLADTMGQWAQIGAANQRGRLIDMQMRQAEQEQGRQDQLRSLYQGGNRPTAEQIYSIDPEMGMKYEAQQSENELYQAKAHKQKMEVAKDIASGIRNKMMQSGLQPGTPEFQQQLDAIGAPYRPIMSGLFGHQDDGKPMNWNALNTIADHVGQSDQDWIVVNDAQNGAFMLNKKDGSVKPVEHGGRQLRPPQYDPNLQGEIMAAREGQKGVRVTNAQGQEYYDTQGNASGGRIGGGQYAPNPALPPNITISPNASPEDRALLEGMARNAGVEPNQGPVLSQSPAEAAAAKAEIDLSKDNKAAEQKKERSAKNIIDMLNTKIEGEDIDSLIDKATGSGIGAARDSAARLVGHATDASIAAEKLATLQEWLVSNVPRMEGPQSNFDVQNYQRMAGKIGDPSIPPEQKKAAFATLKALMKKYEVGGDQPAKTGGRVKFLGFD